ncbi:MAG TPA: deferrochelatase/peroxidase EfeB, partial [Sporichthya sp.]|nr:deferrochelatase/peroxidase EfeB [Sporichthya sp.]
MSSETNPAEPTAPSSAVSRRRALGIAGLGAAAIGGLGYAGRQAAAETGAPAGGRSGESAPRGLPVDFHGEHQAGIATPVQDRLHFATFDVLTD